MSWYNCYYVTDEEAKAQRDKIIWAIFTQYMLGQGFEPDS